MNPKIFSKAKELTKFFSLLYILPVFFLFIVVVASLKMGVSIVCFTRDPASVAKVHPFVGIVSNIGILLWTAAAGVALFNWAIFRYIFNDRKFSTFLLLSGLLTTLLLFDDFFMLHEVVFPHYFGANEKLILLSYGLMMIAWVVSYRKTIMKTEYVVLIVAFGFFGLSMFIDVLQSQIQSRFGNVRILLEDGFKLMGITAWLGYFIKSCFVRQQNLCPASKK